MDWHSGFLFLASVFGVGILFTIIGWSEAESRETIKKVKACLWLLIVGFLVTGFLAAIGAGQR